ncbi:histidine biosynthesis bifunctional protein hisIE chloroplastic [Tripterygium wilfordii]|uniref:Histidine biosynthesis bifunctional protein hisIE chloroplastic n=1 Tax=Tripterygium wilfordii TaxID=458696 RepID=A0A7J7C5A6_TRIWF|nr:histidine biosynthesis bifunctional protein hisIE chloroplastic [Tripterygium wilfordii]
MAIAQNVDTGDILMQGFINRDALATTIFSRKATFYSRSRSTLWTKGETSKNFINILDIFIDCDRDSQVEENKLAQTTLYSLESTIAQRKAELVTLQNGKSSWTKRLLLERKSGTMARSSYNFIGILVCYGLPWEEADELCRTLEENENNSRTASEMGDVLYHAMVLMALKDVNIEDVLEVLRRRFSQSGIEEKRSRKTQG